MKSDFSTSALSEKQKEALAALVWYRYMPVKPQDEIDELKRKGVTGMELMKAAYEFKPVESPTIDELVESDSLEYVMDSLQLSTAP